MPQHDQPRTGAELLQGLLSGAAEEADRMGSPATAAAFRRAAAVAGETPAFPYPGQAVRHLDGALGTVTNIINGGATFIVYWDDGSVSDFLTRDYGDVVLDSLDDGRTE